MSKEVPQLRVRSISYRNKMLLYLCHYDVALFKALLGCIVYILETLHLNSVTSFLYKILPLLSC